MVQSTVDGRSRARRTKQSEEQAPLVESYLSSNSSTSYNGEEEERAPAPGAMRPLASPAPECYRLHQKQRKLPDVILWVFQRAANPRKWFGAGD